MARASSQAHQLVLVERAVAAQIDPLDTVGQRRHRLLDHRALPDPPEMGWTALHGIAVPECGLLRPTQKGPSAMSVTMIGLDTAKAVFHVHGVNETGRAEVRRKLRRSEMIGFFEAQPACTVVLEACGAAHHWGRVLTGLGHTVQLIAPEAVRPFAKSGRVGRPEVKFVPVRACNSRARWRCTRPARCWSSSRPCWPTRCGASRPSSVWSGRWALAS